MAKEGSIVRKGDYEYQTRGGKSYNFNIVKPEKKAAPVKKKPKAEKPEVKPNPLANATGQEQRFRPAPPKQEPYNKPDVKKFNPLTSTTLLNTGKVKSGAEGVGARDFGDVSKPEEPMKGKRFNPLTNTYYKDGGKVRGDGMSRVKTKGRCL
jgi:hypothetical protein